jgi:THAP4-like, heme-binding beta-barrel domain
VELTSDLPPALVPVAWLLGSWAGAGVGGHPEPAEYHFGQELDVTHDGRPFLAWVSQTWLLDDDGVRVRPLAREAGFWRPQPDGDLEVVLAQAEGYAEVWIGTVDGPRIDLQTDVVARSASAPEYTAGRRLYGLVEGDLAWAYDVAARGEPLQASMSARLKRVP